MLMALAALVTASSSDASAARPLAPSGGETACEREIARASKAHDIPPGVLFAVGLTETGRRGSMHPWALNVDGLPIFPASKEEAMERFASARAGGAKLIDLGCMQVNYRYHGQAFNGVADALDPARNVDYAARFLRTLRRSEPSWTLAVARYHAGPNNDPAQKRYVCAVIANLAATGFGVWTPQARSFCDKK